MLILTDVQKVVLSIQPRSAAGNIALVDGKPIWHVSDDAILGLEVSDDGFSATAITTGRLGNARVGVDVDADMGDGVSTISGVIDIEVKASEAVSLDVSAGTPDGK